jgi:hypothetical protein
MQAIGQMHAIVRRRYGTPDVLAYEEIDRPAPGDADVLVRVHAAGKGSPPFTTTIKRLSCAWMQP